MYVLHGSVLYGKPITTHNLQGKYAYAYIGIKTDLCFMISLKDNRSSLRKCAWFIVEHIISLVALQGWLYMSLIKYGFHSCEPGIC